jgi:hypothetical protein
MFYTIPVSLLQCPQEALNIITSYSLLLSSKIQVFDFPRDYLNIQIVSNLIVLNANDKLSVYLLLPP